MLSLLVDFAPVSDWDSVSIRSLLLALDVPLFTCSDGSEVFMDQLGRVFLSAFIPSRTGNEGEGTGLG
jgi:hypothetical protein